MPELLRGSDIIVRSMIGSGVRTLFTLSGNHTLPIYDSLVGTPVRLYHTRHEAAAVHMADAWARLSGEVAVALVTGGPGHSNAISALYTALAAESPVLLLSGHAPTNHVGMGAFQEMRQAEIAAPLCKASWTVTETRRLAHDFARAVRIALTGRRGPVHLSLPVDLLENSIPGTEDLWPPASAYRPEVSNFDAKTIQEFLHEIERCTKPLVICGPGLRLGCDSEISESLASALDAPVITMESPRGVNDPRLGGFSDVLRQTEVVVLLGKPLDFTLHFGAPSLFNASTRFLIIDPDTALLSREVEQLGGRVALHAAGDVYTACQALIDSASPPPGMRSKWRRYVEKVISERPLQSKSISATDGPVHPVEICDMVQRYLDRFVDPILIADGGEFGQWAQAYASAKRTIINGVAGSIGASIPFAVGARAHDPTAPVVALMGDGTFGFHMAEFDTAVRYNLPFVAIVGNDSTWNAEYQLQVRTYGEPRAHGCELAYATRYDQVAVALGGHGEFVERRDELDNAFEHAFSSGKPACVNVLIQRVPAPTMKQRS